MRLRRVGVLAWVICIWVALFVALNCVFVVPVPSSVRTIYIWILTGALVAYVASDAVVRRELEGRGSLGPDELHLFHGRER